MATSGEAVGHDDGICGFADAQGDVAAGVAAGATSGVHEGAFRRRLLAVVAVGAGLTYLAWRVLWTLSDTWWVSVPFLAAEGILFLRFALGVASTLSEPEGEDFSSITGAVGALPSTELLVPAGGADRDAITRTLVPARRWMADICVRVLDDRDRREIREEAERLGAAYEVYDVGPDDGPSALIEAARAGVRSETFAWVDGGDVVVPGFAELAALLADPTRPDVAVVQTSMDLLNSDSLLHLVPDRDEMALQNRVAGPSLSRSGSAPWTGSGSICRVDAIEDIGGVPVGVDATRRGAMRLDRAGWATRWANPPMVRSVAPDTLSDLLVEAGTKAHSDWVSLATRDSALVPVRTRWRRRADQLRSSTAVLDGLARLTLFGVLVATLLTGRVPFDVPLGTFATAFAAQMALRVAATVSLARGTVGVGDTTRQGLRLMGVHVTGLLRSPTSTDSTARGGREVLGQLRLLCLSLIAVDVALAIRGIALFTDGLLPAFDRSAQFMTMAVAVWAIIITVDVLQLLVGRVQRRGVHRSVTDLVATVEDQSCRVVDLTPKGIGFLVPEPGAIDAGPVTIRLEVPRLDGTVSGISMRADLKHIADTVDANSGHFRAGARFGTLEADARDALVEFCALTAEHRDGVRTATASTMPDDLVVGGSSRGRRALGGASVAAVALAGVLVAATPAGAAPADSSGSITGRILDPSGEPMAMACVDIASGPVWATTPSAPDGTFDLSGLADGSYTVRATDCGSIGGTVDTYSGSVLLSQDAMVVTISDGSSATVGDIRLHPAGTMQGRVLDPSGEPAADVCLALVSGEQSQNWWGLGRTGPDGRWQGEAPADVTGGVNLTECADPPRFITTWYPGVTSQSAASTTSVAAGSTQDLGDVTAVPGAVVEGHVTSTDGSSLGSVCVSAQDTSTESYSWMGGSITDADGNYRFLVAPGTYSLSFTDCGTGRDAMSLWYPDTPQWVQPIPTVDVPVSGGRFDAVMQFGGRASGTLVDDTGAPVPGDACVGLRPVASPDSGTSSWDRVNVDGTWTSSPVPAGDYFVEYHGCDESWRDVGKYVTEVRSDLLVGGPDPWSLDDAQPVRIDAGSTTGGLTDDLLRGVRLSGRVTTGGGALGVRGICVGGLSGDAADLRTPNDGTWSAGVVPGRPVTVTFTECETGRGFVQQSRVVQGSPGEEVRLDVDLEMGTPASVSGSVRNGAGHAPATTCVGAYVPSNLITFAPIEADGSFTLSGLGDGDYWIAAFGCAEDIGAMVDPDDPSVQYPPVWYPNTPIRMSENRGPVPSEDGVPPVSVRSATPTAPVDFCLGAGCVVAPTTTVAPTSTTIAPTTTTPTGSSIPATTAPAVGDPVGAGPGGGAGSPASPVAPVGRGGVAGGMRFGAPGRIVGRPGPMSPPVPGDAPTARMEKLSQARGVGSTVEATPAEEGAAASLPTGSVPGYAPSPGAGDPSRVLNANGQPVSRDLVAGVMPEREGMAWDLLVGVAFVAAAAIGLLMLWRRRHPTY